MKLVRTERFKKKFKNLPEYIRELTIKKLDLLLINPHHPSLRVRKIKGIVEGFRDAFEASITMNYRFLFRIEDDSYILLTCGTHDELFK